MASVSVHLCPRCGGHKTVSKPPWVAGDQNTWTGTGTEFYECPTCGGRGYLIVNTEPPFVPDDFGPHDEAGA